MPKKSPGFALKLSSMEILSFSVHPLDSTEILNFDEINYEVRNTIEISEENSLLILTSRLMINDDGDKDYADLSVKFSYTIQDLRGYYIKKEAVYNLPDPMLEIAASIAFSSLRGIIFTLTRGTYLSNLVLPIIDPKQLINKEVHD